MLAIERRNDILERLQADKRVVVSELSAIYQVSEETSEEIWKNWRMTSWSSKVTEEQS